ncbi:hypothetical protein KL921_001032 [Ogataea angusta]|nr:hypothetical protein KL921_001032 [Ogataea angusta]KAG7863715.1 hypothetical protein KL919_001030 [Ogataea angusta]
MCAAHDTQFDQTVFMSVSAASYDSMFLGSSDSTLDQDLYTTFLVADWHTCEHFKESLVGYEGVIKDIGSIRMVGYEAYIVEQWISQRSNKNTVVTYTGDSKDSIICRKVQIINDPIKWPRAFRQYINELLESKYSSPTETDQGIIYITNLSQLESSVTLIPLPQGDIHELYTTFVVNYNLKKLGCGTRSALAICMPTKTVEDKFRNLFQIPPEVSLMYAVREIIAVVQTFLYYYDLLDARFCDGLLCEKTEDAISRWWAMILQIPGCEETLRPNACCSLSASILTILGFTLILKSILETAGNNISVPKDPLDHEKIRIAITQFQRAQKIKNHPGRSDAYSGKFDLETITKLLQFCNSAKSSQTFAKDLHKVRKMVKDTVVDFTSGKTLQTLKLSPTNKSSNKEQEVPASKRLYNCQDPEQIIQLAHGKRLNYLWKCKGHEPDLDRYCLASLAKHHRAAHLPHTPPSMLGDSGTDSEMNTISSSAKALEPSLMSLSADRVRTYDEPLRKQKSKRLIIGGSFQDSDNPTDMRPRMNAYYEGSFEQKQDNTQINQFNARLNRRHSIPSIEKDLNVHTINLHSSNEHVNNSILHSQATLQSRALRSRRANSFSLIQEQLTNDFDEIPTAEVFSMETMALDYLKLLRAYKLGIVKRSNSFKQSVQESRLQLLDRLGLSKYTAEYETSKNEYSKLAKRSHDVNDKLVKNYKINARLKYELRLLLQKTKEVETNLKNLNDFKMASLETKINDLKTKQESSQIPKVEKPQKVSFKVALNKPHLLVSIILNYLSIWWFYLFRNVDNTRIEEQWKLIDRNERVARFLKNFHQGDESISQKNK